MKTKEKAVKVVKNKPKVVITPLQRRTADALVGTGGNVTRAMRVAGYAEGTVNTPQKVTESKGFRALCVELGLTHELIINSLAEDIKKKQQNRKGELELAAKLTGALEDTTKVNDSPITNQTVNIIGKEALSDFIELYRNKVTDKHS